MSSAHYGITDGPTAQQIWDHAKYSQDKTVTMPLRFQTDHVRPGNEREPHYLEPTITLVGHLDDTGQMLQVVGYTTYGSAGGRTRFTGFYDGRSRKGTFIFGA